MWSDALKWLTARGQAATEHALSPRVASVPFDELGRAVLGEEAVDGFAEKGLEGGVAVGRKVPSGRR